MTRLNAASKSLQKARDELESNPDDQEKKKEQITNRASELDRAWRRRAFWAVSIVLVAAAAAAVVGAYLTRSGHQWTPARRALQWAAPITAVAIIAVGWIAPGYSRGGIVGYLIGHDNRISTSKTQIGLWTVAITFAFFFFTIQLLIVTESQQTALIHSFDHFGPEYLLLLGGPFAAAVLAKGATTTKTNDGSVQQVPAAAPKTSDLVSDHDNQPAISDAQFLLFNLVALTYFGVALTRSSSVLPSIPTTLVGLTSVSALTYLGAKVVSSNQPMITTVTITSPGNGKLHGGDTIKIVGSSFNPPGNEIENKTDIAILFDHVEIKPHPGFTDSVIHATVPPGLAHRPNGNVDIAVRTAAGVVTTPPYTGLTMG
ncbi:MAG TPA: IPT/TIG domain-containing protein [Streptosporangiaceae bacterium]